MITVRIPHKAFWDLAQHHDVHMNISVFKALRSHGVPVDGGLDLRGVTRGTLTMRNEVENGERICVYEWVDGPDLLLTNDDDF